MNYEGLIFRPPSEAYSLILQVAVGCAHNSCTFCRMYKDDSFHIKPRSEIFRDIEEVSRYAWKRVFLADGDALIIKTDDLLEIIRKIKKEMPRIERIASYAAVQDIEQKSVEELILLRETGLEMLYIGVESGDDELLKKIRKGVNHDRTKAALIKAKEAGFITSVTLISGLGGIENSERHALESARVMSGTNTDYISFLTLYLEEGAPMYDDLVNGSFKLMNAKECLNEIGIFLEHIDSDGTIFRANHASNYLTLKGTLNRDKKRMTDEIKKALNLGKLRPEIFRAL